MQLAEIMIILMVRIIMAKQLAYIDPDPILSTLQALTH